MTDDSREVLSALIDREPVDPDELARFLEEPEARALLVDFVRLRVSLSEDDDATPAIPRIRPSTAVSRPRRRTWTRAAAALLLVTAVVVGGLWIGVRQSEEQPPTPTRVVEFEPGVDWHGGAWR